MAPVVLRASTDFTRAFDKIRQELDVPTEFPTGVLAEAEASLVDEVPNETLAVTERVDARDLALVAIDPPGATDLDQALAIESLAAGGFRVRYAIADVAAFVTPGGLVDGEARSRGSTLYSPDGRAPLHPPVLSEDRASLLAGTDKPALLWRIDLDPAGAVTDWHLERATVRVAEAISYAEADRRIAEMAATSSPGNRPAVGSVDETLRLLAQVGPVRQEQEALRGGVSLNLPAQEIVQPAEGQYSLAFDESLAVEGWNAQISLLTGMVAGRAMLDSGLGVVRTLPPPADQDVDQLRRIAAALDLNWPDDVGYADYVRTLQPDSPATNAFLLQCTRLFRGAGYVGFNGDPPEHPEHGAIASVYAHVTAPLRRLVDRFGNEIVLALANDRTPPGWAVEALDELPSLMGQARQRESALERSLLDMTEALIMECHLGETFDGVVVDVARQRDQARIQVREPAVVTAIPNDDFALGSTVKLLLETVDVERRSIHFNVL